MMLRALVKRRTIVDDSQKYHPLCTIINYQAGGQMAQRNS